MYDYNKLPRCVDCGAECLPTDEQQEDTDWLLNPICEDCIARMRHEDYLHDLGMEATEKDNA